jgi:hypothetical protein
VTGEGVAVLSWIRDYLAAHKRRFVSRIINPDVERIEVKFAELQRRIAEAGKASSEPQLALVEKFSVASFWSTLDTIYDTTLSHRVLKCIICDHADVRSGFEIKQTECAFGGGKLERYVCPRCDCIFGAQKFLDLAPHLVNLDYQLLYSRYRESNTTANEIRTFHSLMPKAGQLYLNWGAGSWNTTVTDLRDGGFDVWGYEPNTDVHSSFVIKEKALVPKLDGLFSNNVVEHFLDPVAQFREFHSLLKPGTLMAHSTACYEYRYEFSRFHTVFLLGRSVDLLAKRTGFEVIASETDGEYMNRVFRRLN